MCDAKTVQRYRARAQEVRNIASGIGDAHVKATLILVAARWDEMADQLVRVMKLERDAK